jgi:hypothetical protein
VCSDRSVPITPDLPASPINTVCDCPVCALAILPVYPTAHNVLEELPAAIPRVVVQPDGSWPRL